MRRLYLFVLGVLVAYPLLAQSATDADSSGTYSINDHPLFSTPAAWIYVDHAIRDSSLWRSDDDAIKEAMRRLLDHTLESYDTARSRLAMQDFGAIPVHTGAPVLEESVEVRWINDSTFVVDPQGWNTELYLKQETDLVYPVDFSTLTLSDSLLDENGLLDSTLFIADTVLLSVIDTAAMASLGISLHHYSDHVITPPLTDHTGDRMVLLSEDRTRALYFIPGSAWQADENSPFHIVSGEHHLDSLQQAVSTLLDFTERRDSTRLLINDMYGNKTPVWLTTGTEDAFRLWVKNYSNDSITLWVGNPGTGEISLLLEDDVNFSRLVKEEIDHLHSFIQEPERSLHQMTMLEPVPIYWDYEFSSVLTLSQTYLANWTKGGESSFSTMMDLMGRATYNNKEANTQWINIARLKFGTIMTQEKGFRKNHDQFEIDSKFNRNAWGKIGMSASFYMKHQLAKGYNYPNDSVPVSKFLNPGTITVGLGAEYKPMAKTTINVAPLSYKTTFVLDTANIDQTKHGIEADKWAKRELGTQVVIKNEISPLKDLDVINRVRLFSNYLNKPQNVDVDWEMILEKRINWFFTIRLNLHLIDDDDIHFPVYETNDQPVLNPDGSEKEVAKAQFKEFLGLALSFKF